MPYYDYKCKSCGEVYADQQYSIADRLKPTEQTCTVCDELTIILLVGAPAIGDPVRLGIKKPDPAFQNHLKNKRANLCFHHHSKPSNEGR